MNVHGLKSLPVSNSPLTCWSLCFSTCRGFVKVSLLSLGLFSPPRGRSVSVSAFCLVLLFFPLLLSFLYDFLFIQVNVSLRLKSVFQQKRGREARKLNTFLRLALSFISPS